MRTAYLHHARNAVILSWSATSIRRQFLCRTPSKAHFAPFFWCPGGSHNESVLTTKIPRIAILIWLGLGCSVLLSRKFVAAWKETFSGISWDRAHLACTRDSWCTQDACGPRRQLLMDHARIFIEDTKTSRITNSCRLWRPPKERSRPASSISHSG